ncbi:hypothetical protein PFISCL1PPCAC_16303, partial [Pristionchus fissidentatus]
QRQQPMNKMCHIKRFYYSIFEGTLNGKLDGRLPVSSVAMRQSLSEHGSAHNCSGGNGGSMMVMVIVKTDHGRCSDDDGHGRGRDVDRRRRSDHHGHGRSNDHGHGRRRNRSNHDGMGEVVEADFVYGDVASDVEGRDVVGVSTMVEVGEDETIDSNLEVSGVVLDLEVEVGSNAEGQRVSLLGVPVTIMEVVEYNNVLVESDVHVHKGAMMGEKFDCESAECSHIGHSVDLHFRSITHSVHERGCQRNHRVFDHHGCRCSVREKGSKWGGRVE